MYTLYIPMPHIIETCEGHPFVPEDYLDLSVLKQQFLWQAYI